MVTQKFPFSYDSEKDAIEYIESCEGKDNRFLIDIVKKHLKPNSTLLELGMGPGNDFDILREDFNVTGSDNSQTFLSLYKKKNPAADLLLLDAVTMKTGRKFDCIYSNKVLHHLTRDELKKSLAKQKELLNQNGILFHTFWHGDKSEEFNGLHFTHYQLNELKHLFEEEFELIEICLYEEMKTDDSILVVASFN